ncbi:MAG TPA: hypothetical protein VKB49_25100 [Candidatus Sulfotelmatobacter sp.]|nr:hypothetical protein [Candidatus Sulfotelmatobacter sp.]
MDEVGKALKKVSVSGFCGQIQIDFRDGKPAVIRVVETTNLNRDEDKRNEKTYRY